MRLFSPFHLTAVKIGEDCTGFLLLKKIFFAVNFPRNNLHYPHRGVGRRFAGAVFVDFMRINVQK